MCCFIFYVKKILESCSIDVWKGLLRCLTFNLMTIRNYDITINLKTQSNQIFLIIGTAIARIP